MRPSRVDLPLPDGPATARNWPGGTSSVTSVKTSTWRPPLVSRIERSRMLIIAKSILHSGVRAARLVLLLFLSVTAGALSAAAGAGAEEPVVVAFGDSLTAGLGVSPAEAYPALLEARLRKEGYAYRVVNAGVSGDTTAGGLRRVDWALRLKPAVVIVELGANDALRGQDLGGVRANLDTIVERFQAAGARVLVAGMRVPTELRRAVRRRVRAALRGGGGQAQGGLHALLSRRRGGRRAPQSGRRHSPDRGRVPDHRGPPLALPAPAARK